MESELAPHTRLPEPKLAFHPDRPSDCEIHPLRGLLRFGPYSSTLVPDPIRIATIAPWGESQQLYDFMKKLNEVYRPGERLDYLPEWPGFASVFKVRMTGAGGQCHAELEESLERELFEKASPHVILADAITRAIQGLETLRPRFDVLFLYLPKRWEPFFRGGDDEYDLHDHLKASTAMRNMPIQVVREDKALAYRDRASVMWRIGLALYVKAGGVPWKLADTSRDTAYIGLSYAVRKPEAGGARFVTCCSQVFDAEGSGLEFVAYDASEVEVRKENPFLSRTEMFRVMTRAMDLYRRRHAGQTPSRVMVHKTTEFKNDEISGAMEALHLCEAVDLVQIVQDVGWKGIRIDSRSPAVGKGKATSFPVERGTVLSLGPREALLWTHGDARGISQRGGSYFQGGKGTPRPLRLVRHAGHGSWDDTAYAVLALTKMNWNNDALYDSLPVTISYSEILARVVKRMSGLGSLPYQCRFFM